MNQNIAFLREAFYVWIKECWIAYYWLELKHSMFELKSYMVESNDWAEEFFSELGHGKRTIIATEVLTHIAIFPFLQCY